MWRTSSWSPTYQRLLFFSMINLQIYWRYSFLLRKSSPLQLVWDLFHSSMWSGTTTFWLILSRGRTLEENVSSIIFLLIHNSLFLVYRLLQSCGLVVVCFLKKTTIKLINFRYISIVPFEKTTVRILMVKTKQKNIIFIVELLKVMYFCNEILIIFVHISTVKVFLNFYLSLMIFFKHLKVQMYFWNNKLTVSIYQRWRYFFLTFLKVNGIF